MTTLQSTKPTTTEWFAATRSGNDETIAKLLSQWPELVTECDSEGKTALHTAARGGHDKVVGRLLAVCPALVNVTTDYLRRTALHFAAERGHDKIVAQLLAAGPHSIGAATADDVNALHLAANGGHDKVVALILEASPSLITSTDKWGRTALSYTAASGHANVFAQLLAACPQLIDKEKTILHLAAQKGHDNIVALIVEAYPEKVSALDRHGWTALKWSIDNGQQHVAERLLAIQSDEVFDVSHPHYTLLHAATRKCSYEFVAKLWRVNPAALRVVSYGSTPFQDAVKHKRNDLIELFQWSLSFDEIAAAFTQQKASFEERYRPMTEEQCECLMASLGHDVVGTVFEYLGFEPYKRTSPSQRKYTHLAID